MTDEVCGERFFSDCTARAASVTNYCVTALNSNYSLDLDFLIMSNPNLACERKTAIVE